MGGLPSFASLVGIRAKLRFGDGPGSTWFGL